MRKFNKKELAYLETELRKYKSPWISRIVIKSWFKFGRYAIFPIFVLILILGAIYSSLGDNWTPTHDIMWNVILSLVFTLLEIGVILLIAHLLQQYKTNKMIKELELSIEEWNFLVEKFKIEM
jgi:uncharacterized membrane protein